MLPNHAPLVIAEQFGTLESLYPGRIDLGLGRAPGHRPAHRAGAAPRPGSADTFPQRRAGAAGLPRARAAGPGGPGRARARDSRCRSGSWARACSARSSPPSSACRSPSPRTSRPMPDARRCDSTAPTFKPSEQLDTAVRHGRRQRDRGRHRRRGAAAVHLAPAARSPAMVRGTRGQLPPPIDDIDALLVARGEGAGRRACCLLVRRLARDGARRARAVRRARPGPTS